MKRRLTLKTEHLAELTNDELLLAGGGAGEMFTGNPVCILSLKPPCVSNDFCTNLCIDRLVGTIQTVA